MTVQDSALMFAVNLTQHNTSYNDTSIPGIPPHPLWLTIVLGLLAGIVSLVTILGNITVLLAFGLERTIRQPTNYFLASLAVSDLLIGTFSMPLYTQYLLQGSWPPELGPWICDIWLSLDFTVCLTSQYNVFLITMDRYLSVKIPAKYRNWRTERKVILMIAFTWVLPASVFFTIIIGWQFFTNDSDRKQGECDAAFMQNPIFAFVLTIGYFWITLLVMTTLYAGIYKIALDLQKKSDAKHKKFNSAMELAGENPQLGIRSFQPGEGGSNNNSSGADSQLSNQKSKLGGPDAVSGRKPSAKKSLTSAITFSRSSKKSTLQTNTTSFSGSKPEEDRSSSPAFASDEENSSSGGGHSSGRSPMPNRGRSLDIGGGAPPNMAQVVGLIGKSNKSQRSHSTAGPVGFGGSVSNQGAASRAGNLDVVLSAGSESGGEDTHCLLQTPLYNNMCDLSDTDSRGEEKVASCDKQDKQTTPLLKPSLSLKGDRSSNEIARGSRFIDRQSLLATLKESAALLPAFASVAEPDDMEATEVQVGSPIWKRRCSLPPLSSFNTEFNMSPVSTLPFCEIDEKLSSLGIQLNNTEISPSSNTACVKANNQHDGNQSSANPTPPVTTYQPTSTLPLPYFGGKQAPDGKITCSRSSTDLAKNKTAAGIIESLKNSSSAKCLNTDGVAVAAATDESETAPTPRRPRPTLQALVRAIRPQNSRRRNRRDRKSKSENRARKALRTISFILGAFVVCWIPYHVIVLLYALDIKVNGDLYGFSYWLCYLNSPINPFCYAFVNNQFKRTFIRIMKLDWHKT